MLTIISWYTKNTPYKEVCDTHILESLKKLAIPYKIYEVEPRNNWVSNTNLKQEVILKALDEVPGDLLVLDADAKILDIPSLLNTIQLKYDIGLFYLNWNEWYQNTSNKIELCSGTIFLRNRANVKKLINDWNFLSTNNGNKLCDQRFLEMALKANPDLNIYKLPYEYCWITSMPNGDEPKVPRPEKVIIEHYQKSRELKNKI